VASFVSPFQSVRSCLIPRRPRLTSFAPWETVYGYLAAWQKDGVFDQLNGVLRRLLREAEGREGEPSACVLDAHQSVKTSANVPTAGQGIDAGKKIAGRQRHLGVDTLRLLLAVLVTAASVSDNTGGIHLLSQISNAHPRRHQGLSGQRLSHQGNRARRPSRRRRRGDPVRPRPEGLQVIPRRWVVELTFGWLMHHRRLARDYEAHPHRSEAT
jgi:transposase